MIKLALLILAFLIVFPLVIMLSLESKELSDADSEALKAGLYDQYISMLVRGGVGEGEVIYFSDTMVTKNDERIILQLSYYIAANELRGFEISFPRQHIIFKANSLETKTQLEIDEQSFQQQLHVLALEVASNEADTNGGR